MSRYVSRRSALSAAALPASAALTATVSSSLAQTAEQSLAVTTAGSDIHALSLQWLDAVRFEMSIECRKDEPGYDAYQAAICASEALQARIDTIADKHYPPRGLNDLVALAEHARHWREPSFGEIRNESMSRDEVALVRLANAVLRLAGRVPMTLPESTS